MSDWYRLTAMQSRRLLRRNACPHSVTCPHLTCTGRQHSANILGRYLCLVGGVIFSSRRVEYIIVEINAVRFARPTLQTSIDHHVLNPTHIT
jgi:hypothetical protein